MTASVTTATAGLAHNLNKVKPFKNEQTSGAKSSSSEQQLQSNTTKRITSNPFLNDFFDCIANLPSKLQILISELRSVDAQVNAHHRKLQLVKQVIFSKISGSDDKKSNQDKSSAESSLICYESYSIGELLNLLHKILVQCQIFGDQKVKLTSQIMETLSSKTRQLGFDSETYEERNFQIELDEEKIINEFKMSIKKRSMRHHYNCSSSGARNTTGRSGSTNNGASSFHSTSQQLAARSQKSLVDMNKFKSTKGLFSLQSTSRNNSIQLDAYSFDENPTQSIYQNNINNSLRNLNNSNTNPIKSNKNSNVRHKPGVATSFSSNKKMILNNSSTNNINTKTSSKKLRLEASSMSGSSTNNSPFLSSKLALFKQQHESTDDNSNLTRPKRQLGSHTPEEIGMSKKRRLNQLKQSVSLSNNSNQNSNQCKSPSSSTSSYSSNNSKNANKRSIGAENHKNENKKLKKANCTKQIIKKHFSNIINDEQQQQRSTTSNKEKKELISKKLLNRNNRMHTDNPIDSEEYENFDINDNKMAHANLLPTYDDLIEEKNAEQLDELNERNSNETESINHIDNDEDDDDLGDLNSDDQLDEDDNRSIRFNEDAESNVGDDEQEDDDEDDNDGDDDAENNNEDEEDEEKNNEIDDDENEIDDYNEDDPIDNNTDQDDEEDASNVNENELDENSENQSYAINHQPNKYKTNRHGKNLNSATISSNTTSTNTNQNNTNNTNTANEDEETYCTCEQISYGQMICCDNKACKIEWFHFNCVKLTTKPKGKWYCPNCRGDTHKVMKKTANKTHLSSSNYSNFNSSNNTNNNSNNNNNSGYHSSYRAK